MSRPAGWSDDEYSDDGFDYPEFTAAVKPPVELSLNEKFLRAILDSDIEKISEYLSNGADVNFKEESKGSWSPLMHACHLGNKDIVNILLSNGADVNMESELVTPVMCVCSSVSKNEDELLKCLNILLSHEARLDCIDWYKTTPLMQAVKYDHPKLVLKLLEMGCRLDQADSDGWTPMFFAVDADNAHMVQLLKDAGAVLTTEDRRGRTLVEIAESKGFKDLAEMVSTKSLELKETAASNQSKLTSYELLMHQCPDLSKGRLYGFSDDALKIIDGIGMHCLAKVFVENNIQLGELFTWDDQQWKNAGVDMSFDRQKIKASVQKYHEHPWSKQSLETIDPKKELTLLHITQFMCNLVKQLHIVSVTTLYCMENLNDFQDQKDIDVFLKRGLKDINLIKKHLNSIKALAAEIDKSNCVVPADLILPKERKIFSFKNVVLPMIVISFLFFQAPKWGFTRHLLSKVST